MSQSMFRVNAVNAWSMVTLAVVFGIILAAIVVWRDGASRLIALSVAGALLALIVAHMCTAKVHLEEAGLRLGTGLYRITVPWQAVIAPAQDTRVRWRTNGIGLPGFALGWFSAADKRRVFMACGRRRDAVRIRLHGAFDVIVGVADREAFLRALKAHLLLAKSRQGD